MDFLVETKIIEKENKMKWQYKIHRGIFCKPNGKCLKLIIIPSRCSKEGLLSPNNRFHIAFGDAYCMDCKGRAASRDPIMLKLNKQHQNVQYVYLQREYIFQNT